jgi:hypothetical protein
MLLCEAIWNACKRTEPKPVLHTFPELLSVTSPQLITILRAFACTSNWGYSLLQLHILLNISWDDLRSVICALRTNVGQDEQRLRALFFFASSLALPADPNFDSTIWGFAQGGLQVMKRIFAGEIPLYYL